MDMNKLQTAVKVAAKPITIIAVVIAALIASQTIVGLIWPDMSQMGQTFAAEALTAVALAVLLYAVSSNVLKTPKQYMRIAFRYFVLGMMVQLVLGTAVHLYHQWIPPADDWVKVQQTYQQISPLVSYSLAATLAPVFEELLFRGAVIESMLAMSPSPKMRKAAVIVSALLFALAHSALVQMIYTFILGLVCAHVYLKKKTILAPIALHAGFNAASPLVALLIAGFTA